MKAASNAGPLIALGKLGALPLLVRLFSEVVIPSAVYEEVVVNGRQLGEPDAYATEFLVGRGAIVVRACASVQPTPWLGLGIDAGEAEAIALAIQENADWVLIDNLHARRAARSVGLRVKGTVGVLIDAYRNGHLSLLEVELHLAMIRARKDLWISVAVCDHALELIHKPPG